MTNAANLSEAAKTALINTTPRQGAVPMGADMRTLTLLALEGLIGEDGGLTRKGVTTRQALVDAKLDELF